MRREGCTWVSIEKKVTREDGGRRVDSQSDEVERGEREELRKGGWRRGKKGGIKGDGKESK